MIFHSIKYKCRTQLFLLFFLVFILIDNSLYAQEKKRVEILDAEFLAAAQNIAENAQRLVGHVQLKHENILIWCDSAYTYTGTNKVDAFGNVHINQNDTLHLYANKIYYNGDISFAQAIKNVRLENKSTTLYSDTLDYDLAADIAYYDNYGKIVDSTNVLTSQIGKYLIQEDLIHFYNDVEAFSDDYTLVSDSLHYHTESGRLFILGPTTIRDSANTLYAEKGWYDSKTGEAELTKKPVISNETQLLKARYIKYNEEDGNGLAKNQVEIEDYENKVKVLGNYAVYNETLEKATVSDSALFIMYAETDTLYMHADTLKTVPDTIEGEKVITAFYGARFYRTDMQGLCDSLVYFTKDSVIQLYRDPIIWSDIHQVTADKIELKQMTDAPDEMHLSSNSFIISKQDSGRFDQIKGKNMVGFIVNNEINKIDVDGNGQTLYYAREDNEIIGLNRAESSNISIQFKEGKIYRILFLTQPKGKLKPLFDLTEEEKKLDGFEWKIQMRPLSKHDVFPKVNTEQKEEEEIEPN